MVSVGNNLVLTMIDSNMYNALTDTISTHKCYFCGAMSKGFNRINEMITKWQVREDNIVKKTKPNSKRI